MYIHGEEGAVHKHLIIHSSFCLKPARRIGQYRFTQSLRYFFLYLQVLSAKDSFGGLNAEIAPECRHLRQVQSLRIEGRITSTGVSKLVGLLAIMPSLSAASFCNSFHACDAHSVLGALDSCSALSKLHVRGITLSGRKQGQRILPLASTGLVDLVLSGANLGVGGAQALAGPLASCTALTKLWLNSNAMCAAGMTPCAPALAKLTALQELNLSENSIEAAGAMTIAPAVGSLSALKQLLLAANNLSGAGIDAIAKAVSDLPALTLLDLEGGNVSESSDAAAKQACLSLADATSKLRDLHISGISAEMVGSGVVCLSCWPRKHSKFSL